MGCKIHLFPNYYRPYHLSSIGQCIKDYLNLTPVQLCQLWRRCNLFETVTLSLSMYSYVVLHLASTTFQPKHFVSKTYPWNEKVYTLKFHNAPSDIMIDEERALYDISEEICGISYTKNLYKSWYKDTKPKLDALSEIYIAACIANMISIFSAVVCKSNLYWIEMLRLGWVIACQIASAVIGTSAAFLLVSTGYMCLLDNLPRLRLRRWIYSMMFINFLIMKAIMISMTIWVFLTEMKKRAMWLKLKEDCLKEFQKIDKLYYSKRFYETVFPGGTSWGPEFMVIGSYFNIHMARFLGRLPPARKRTRKENKSILQGLFDTLYPKPKQLLRTNWEPNEYQKTLHAGYWPHRKYVKHHALTKLDEYQNDKGKHEKKGKISRKPPVLNRKGKFEKRVTIVDPESSRDEQRQRTPTSHDNDKLFSEGEQSLFDFTTQNQKRRSSASLFTLKAQDNYGKTSKTEDITQNKSIKTKNTMKRNVSIKASGAKQGKDSFLTNLRENIHAIFKKLCCCCGIFDPYVKRINRWKRKLHRQFLKLFTWSRYVHYRFQWFYPGAVKHHSWEKRPRDLFFKNIKIINGKIVPIVDYHLWGTRPKGLWENVPQKKKRTKKHRKGLQTAKENGKESQPIDSTAERHRLSNNEKRMMREDNENGSLDTITTLMHPHSSETENGVNDPHREAFPDIYQSKKSRISNKQKRHEKSKEERRRKWEFIMKHKILEPVKRYNDETDQMFHGREYLWQLEAMRLRAEQRRRRRRRLRRYIKTRFKKRRIKDASRNLKMSSLIEVYHAPPEVFIDRDRLGRLRSEMLQYQADIVPSSSTVEIDDTELDVPIYDFQALRSHKFRENIFQHPGYTYVPSRRVGKDGQWVPDINLDAVTEMNHRIIPVPNKWKPKAWALPRITLQRPSDEFGNLPPVEILFDPITHPHIDLTHTELKVVFHVENNPRNYFRTYKGDIEREVYIKKKRLLITEKRDYVFYKRFLKKSQRWHKTPDKYRKIYPGSYWDRIIYDQTGEVPQTLYWSKKLGRKLSKLWDLRWGTKVRKVDTFSNRHLNVKKEKTKVEETETETHEILERKAVNLFQHHLFNTPMEKSERQKIMQRAPSVARPRGTLFTHNYQRESSKKKKNRVKRRINKPLRPYFAIPIDLPPSLLTEPDRFPLAKGQQRTQSESDQTGLRRSKTLSQLKFTPELLRRKLDEAKTNLLNRGSAINLKQQRSLQLVRSSHSQFINRSQSRLNIPRDRNVAQNKNSYTKLQQTWSTTERLAKIKPNRLSLFDLKSRPRTKSKSEGLAKIIDSLESDPNQMNSRGKLPQFQPMRHTRHDIQHHKNTSPGFPQNPIQDKDGAVLNENSSNPTVTLPEFTSRPPPELYRDLNFTLFKPETGEKKKSASIKDDDAILDLQPDLAADSKGSLFFTKKRLGTEKKPTPITAMDIEKDKAAQQERIGNVPLSIVNNYRADRLKTIMIKEARRIFVHKLINFRRRFLTEQKIELIKRGYSLGTIHKWQKEYYEDKRNLPGHLHGYKFKYATFN